MVAFQQYTPEQQSRFNRRKILVAFAFFFPFFLWLGFTRGGAGYIPPQFVPLLALTYFVIIYFAANAILRWMARRWP